MFTKQEISLLRVKLNKRLEEIGKEFNLKLELGNATFLPFKATFKLDVIMPNETGDFNVDKRNFDKFCSLFGLKPEHFGMKFKWGLDEYEIAGIKERNHKYPIIVVARGKRFKLPARLVTECLSKMES